MITDMDVFHLVKLSQLIQSGKATEEEKAAYLRLKQEQEQYIEQQIQQQEERKRLKKERYLQEVRRWHLQIDPVSVFLKEEISYDPLCSISSKELYEIYCQWCIKEKIPALPIRSLCYRLKHGTNQAVSPCTMTKDGKRCRGFRGISAVADVTHNV